jgi:hypothetical protein
MDSSQQPLSHDEMWDDSILIESWNEALTEYKVTSNEPPRKDDQGERQLIRSRNITAFMQRAAVSARLTWGQPPRRTRRSPRCSEIIYEDDGRFPANLELLTGDLHRARTEVTPEAPVENPPGAPPSDLVSVDSPTARPWHDYPERIRADQSLAEL